MEEAQTFLNFRGSPLFDWNTLVNVWRDVKMNQPLSWSLESSKTDLLLSPLQGIQWALNKYLLFWIKGDVILGCTFSIYHNGPLPIFFFLNDVSRESLTMRCKDLGEGEWWKRIKKWNQQVSGQERRGFEWAAKSWKQEGVAQGKLERCGGTFKRVHLGEMRMRQE